MSHVYAIIIYIVGIFDKLYILTLTNNCLSTTEEQNKFDLSLP